MMSSIYALKNPCHPGAFIRRNIVEPRNLTVMAAAALIGVTRQALSDLLNEKTSLSAEMALRLEKAFGFKMEAMMEMQKQFDIAKVSWRVRVSSMLKRTLRRKDGFAPSARGLPNLRHDGTSMAPCRGFGALKAFV
jgi:addiction module HigA family antidote